ncbi:MAG TPA: hypothetical protein VGP33_18980, partial [Chloroflexota bacterium]|nr:hypothetical protein [Chloroflexota bacterium]
MVPSPTMPGTGGLFKSPFPSDAPPATPRSPTQPGGQPGGQPGAGGDPHAQRPDLQVDWSHLER